MRRIDGYLSRRMQSVWPSALVYEDDAGEWVLERPSHPEPQLGLGDSYGLAKQAIDALLRQARTKRGASDR